MPKDLQLSVAQLLEPHDAMRYRMDDEKLAELMNSIRHDGILEPLLAILITEEYYRTWPEPIDTILNRIIAGESLYEVRAGHRRLIACRQIGFTLIPCRIFSPDEPAYAGLMATENLIREECTPFEEGCLFARIRDTEGITEDEMRRKCGGKSLPYIYDRIALVQGDKDVALAVHEGQISLGVAKKLNQIRYPAPGQQGEKFVGEALQNAKASADAYRAMFLERAVTGGCTIAVAESWVAQWRQSAGIVVQSSAPPTEAMPAGGYEMPKAVCALCREEGEPHEMETITVHRNELAAFRAALAAQGGQ
jgi:ParB-like chromosome segregation protein Spo0J